jgi:hypothetical protein
VRALLAERQSVKSHAGAIVAEAKLAAAHEDWATVIALCDEALMHDPAAGEAAGLRDRGRTAIEAGARERATQLRRALDSVNAMLLAGQWDAAERELGRAKSLEPDAPAVRAAEDAVRQGRLDAERATERDRQGAQAIAVARAAFASGAGTGARRSEAFLTREPQAEAVVAELASLTSSGRGAGRSAAAAAVAAHAKSGSGAPGRRSISLEVRVTGARPRSAACARAQGPGAGHRAPPRARGNEEARGERRAQPGRGEAATRPGKIPEGAAAFRRRRHLESREPGAGGAARGDSRP